MDTISVSGRLALTLHCIAFYTQIEHDYFIQLKLFTVDRKRHNVACSKSHTEPIISFALILFVLLRFNLAV